MNPSKVVVGLMGALMPVVDGTLAERYRSEVDAAAAVLDSGQLSRLSPDVAFLLPTGEPAPLLELESLLRGVPAEDAALLARVSGVEGNLPERRGLAPRFAYLELKDLKSFYFYHLRFP